MLFTCIKKHYKYVCVWGGGGGSNCVHSHMNITQMGPGNRLQYEVQLTNSTFQIIP